METAILIFSIIAAIAAVAALVNVIYVNIKVEALTKTIVDLFPETEEEADTDEEILEILGRMELNVAKVMQRVGKLQARARGQQRRKKDEDEVTPEEDPAPQSAPEAVPVAEG